jgi:hypothetical protein
MTGTEIYKRTDDYEREARTIRLHAPQWKLLLAFDGQRSLAEVALSVDVAFAEALPCTEQFLGRGWIAEQPITLDQYLKRTGAPSISAIGAAVPPPVVLHQPRPETVPLPFVPASAVMEETTPIFQRGTPEKPSVAVPPILSSSSRTTAHSASSPSTAFFSVCRRPCSRPRISSRSIWSMTPRWSRPRR